MFNKNKFDFIGVDKLLVAHYEQVCLFEKWASSSTWVEFHSNHYDWWAFPIDKSSGFKGKYQVDAESVSIMLNNKEFNISLAKAIDLSLLAWGWDVLSSGPLNKAPKGAYWCDKPIRLWKAWRSTYIFNLIEKEKEILIFAKYLKSNNCDFYYKSDLYPDLLERIKYYNL